MTGPTRTRRHAARAVLILLVALWVCAFICTHMPGRNIPSTGMDDKKLHVVGFFVLASLLLLTLSSHLVPRAPRMWLTLCIMAAYAAMDELTQPWFGRGCEGLDWVSDMTGTAVAIIFWELLFTTARTGSWLAKLAGRRARRA